MSKSNVVSQNVQLVSGLQKDFPKRVFELDGQQWKTVDLVTAFNDENSLIAAAANAGALWKTAVATMRAKTAANSKPRLALYGALKQALGANSPKLVADFGYAPRVRKAPSPTTVANAAQKRAATRAARGILGRRKRQAVKGVVQTPAVTPSANTAPAGNASSTTTLK